MAREPFGRDGLSSPSLLLALTTHTRSCTCTIPAQLASDVGLNGFQPSLWRSTARMWLQSFWLVSFAWSCEQCSHCQNVFSSVTLPARHYFALAILISWLLCSISRRLILPSFQTHHHRKVSPFLTNPLQHQTSIPKLQITNLPAQIQTRCQTLLL